MKNLLNAAAFIRGNTVSDIVCQTLLNNDKGDSQSVAQGAHSVVRPLVEQQCETFLPSLFRSVCILSAPSQSLTDPRSGIIVQFQVTKELEGLGIKLNDCNTSPQNWNHVTLNVSCQIFQRQSVLIPLSVLGLQIEHSVLY